MHGRVNARRPDHHVLGREPVAVPAVDGLLGRPQGSDRLAALPDLGELGTHHPAQDPLAAMRRVHADDRDAGAREGASRDAQLEGERTGAGDDRVAVEDGDRSLERQHLSEPLGVLGGPAAAEVVADAAERGQVLLGGTGLSQAQSHQPIFSSGAYSSISFRSL